jgi:hypothetical protein
VQFDHHAFLFWPSTSLAVLPAEVFGAASSPPGQPTPGPGTRSTGGDQPFVGAIGFHVDRSGIAELGRISHPANDNTQWPIQRSIVIGDHLFTLSDAGVMSSSLDGLAAQGFAAFPAPAPPPPQPLSAAGAAR